MAHPITPHEAQALERDSSRMREALEEFASLAHANRKAIPPKRVTDYDEDAGETSTPMPVPESVPMIPDFSPIESDSDSDELFFVEPASTRPATDTVVSVGEPAVTFPLPGPSVDDSKPVPPQSGDSIDDAFNGFRWA